MTKKLLAMLAVVCLAWTAFGAFLLWPDRDRDTSSESVSTVATETSSQGETVDEETDPVGGAPDAAVAPPAAAAPGEGTFALEEAATPTPVQPALKHPPASGVLFDIDSGEVLWERRPRLAVPIASLTKMMTALLIAEGHRATEQVLVSAKAPSVEGSRIGVLKPGLKVPLRGLFLGLLLASGNDAAVALAEHDAGTVGAFVTRMNQRATELGLGCSQFAGPAGLQDSGNSSCATDLAALARADLANEWISSVTSRRSASVPFPTKGGTLELANNHYFAQRGIAGIPGAQVTGLKTGYTNGAGRCYVTTARLGDTHLGVVLLDSSNPIRQVPQLLREGFEATTSFPPAPKPPLRD